MNMEALQEMLNIAKKVAKEHNIDIPEEMLAKLNNITMALNDSKHFDDIPPCLRDAISGINEKQYGIDIKATLIMLSVENVKLIKQVDALETQAGIRAKGSRRITETLEKKVAELQQLYAIATTRLDSHYDEIIELQKAMGTARG